MYAALAGHRAVIVELLASGGDVNQTNKKGFTALMLAAMNGHSVAAHALLEAGADVATLNSEASNMTALLYACQNGHDRTVRKLFEYGAAPQEVDASGLGGLMLACRSGHEDVVATLAQMSSDVDQRSADGSTPLLIAGENGHHGTIRALLTAGANPNLAHRGDESKEGRTPLMASCRNGHIECARALLEGGCDPNQQGGQFGMTALMAVAQFGGEAACVTILCAKRADPNHTNKRDAMSVLMLSCQYGFSEVAEALLACGAAIDATDDHGDAALHHASKNGHAECVRALRIAGARVDSINVLGASALMQAISRGSESHKEVVAALLDGGGVGPPANVNLADRSGRTALMIACGSGELGLVQMLTRADAQLDLADRFGTPALRVAYRNGNEQVAAWLLECGAPPVDQSEATSTLRSDGQNRSSQSLLDDSLALPRDGAAAWRSANPSELMDGIASDDPERQLAAVTRIRKLLSIERSPPIDEVIDAGAVPRLTHLLEHASNPMLQFESAWALTNIASGTSENTRTVIACGALPIFVQLLNSSNDDVREQAVWALGNISGDGPELRDVVLEHHTLAPLLEQLTPNSTMSMLRNATWTLSNLVRGKPQPAWSMVSPAVPVLAQLIFSSDDEVLADGCWALSHLSDGPNEKIQAVLDTGICVRIVELMGHPSPAVQTPALRTVGNVVTGDDNQTQCAIYAGAIARLLALLHSPNKGIRKEACWTISNITAGTREQIQVVIDAGIITPLVHLLATAEFDIKKEAAWCVSNATSGGSPAQISYIVQQGSIEPLCDLLTWGDARLVMVALEGLENILKAGEYEAPNNSGTNPYTARVEVGIEKLQRVAERPEDVGKKAVDILEAYFGLGEDSE